MKYSLQQAFEIVARRMPEDKYFNIQMTYWQMRHPGAKPFIRWEIVREGHDTIQCGTLDAAMAAFCETMRGDTPLSETHQVVYESEFERFIMAPQDDIINAINAICDAPDLLPTTELCPDAQYALSIADKLGKISL